MGTEAGGGPPSGEEDLLGYVFGGIAILRAQKCVRELDDPPLVASDQGIESGRIALAGGLD